MKRLYKIILLLGIVLAFVIILYNVYILFNPSVKTQIVVKGTIEECISSDAVVIRNEEVVLKESNVIVSSVVVDGERVSKGEKLADLYYGSVSPEVQAELREVNEKLVSLENLTGKTTDGGNSLDTIVKECASQIVRSSHAGNGRELLKIRNRIEDVVNRKIASNSANAAAVIGELKTKQAQLEGQVSGEKKEAYASTAGLYFSVFDGYEGVIGAENINTLTPGAIAEMKKLKANKNDYDATMKIADGYGWYVAATIDEGKLPSVQEGKSIELRFPQYGGQVYPAEIVHISEPENGQAAIVCKGTAYNDAVYYNRFLNVEIVLNSYTGLKFFKDAVKVVNDKTGVFVAKSDGVAKFKEVEVLTSDEGYTVVKEDNLKENALLLYDEVIITSNPIQDGDVVKY